MDTERTAVLILRAWAEARPSGLRVSIRHTSAVGNGLWRTVHLSDAKATERFVSTWLRELEETITEAAPPTPDDDTPASNGASPD